MLRFPCPGQLHAERLGEAEVHLWFGSLDAFGPDRIADLAEHLSPEEWERERAYALPHLRRRFLVRRSILRRILAGYMECDPQSVVFRKAQHGKPAVTGGPSFNISDCEDAFVCAVTREGRIGIDIERLRPLDDFAEIAERYFSPDEIETFKGIPSQKKREAFFCGWTRKEAFLKAEGSGLSRPLDSFHVELAPDRPARIWSVDGTSDGVRGWSLQDIRPVPGLIGAVACAPDCGSPPRIARTLRRIETLCP